MGCDKCTESKNDDEIDMDELSLEKRLWILANEVESETDLIIEEWKESATEWKLVDTEGSVWRWDREIEPNMIELAMVEEEWEEVKNSELDLTIFDGEVELSTENLLESKDDFETSCCVKEVIEIECERTNELKVACDEIVWEKGDNSWEFNEKVVSCEVVFIDIKDCWIQIDFWWDIVDMEWSNTENPVLKLVISTLENVESCEA